MNKKQIVYTSLTVSIISFLIAIYYMVPGITHILVSTDSTGAHYKHALLFFGIAVIGIIVAAVNRKK